MILNVSLIQIKNTTLKAELGHLIETTFKRAAKVPGIFGLMLALIVCSSWKVSPVFAVDPNTGPVPDHYIIKIRLIENAAAVANEMAFTHGLAAGHIYRHALNGFSARVPQGRLNALRSDPRVVSIVADRYVSIDRPPCATPPCGGGGAVIAMILRKRFPTGSSA